MSPTKKIRRAAAAAALIATPLLTIPTASATPPGADGHKVTICHVTNSATNPYVVITVDVAAFDGEGKKDHSHHESKDGRTDHLAVDGQCGVAPSPSPAP